MGTGQVEQQFAIARLRALETSRYVVVVATNGVSGIVAPDGTVIRRVPTRTAAVLERDLPLRTATTPALRFSGWVEGALVLVALAALVASVVDRRTSRRPGPPAEPPAAVPADAVDEPQTSRT
jgi:apolipoprotein N-acyltransferase